MRNIHVLPTDRPSRLQLNVNTKMLVLFNNIQSNNESAHLTTQNIYITSDEEIKEGDYSFYPPFGVGENIVINGELCFHIERKNGKGSFTQRTYQTLDLNKKIILTTDQDLIKDGVQAIDDEFLEWFVKNPSCEEVKIKPLLSNNGRALFGYKIIIPKEEPKQCDICKMAPRLEGTNKCESCYSVVRHVLEQDLRFKDNLLPDLRKK